MLADEIAHTPAEAFRELSVWLQVMICASGWFARKKTGNNTLATVLFAEPGGR